MGDNKCYMNTVLVCLFNFDTDNLFENNAYNNFFK